MKEIFPKKPDDITNFGKSVLAMAVIDQKDNLTRNIVYDHRDMKLTTCVRVSQRLTGDKIGLYAHRNGGAIFFCQGYGGYFRSQLN